MRFLLNFKHQFFLIQLAFQIKKRRKVPSCLLLISLFQEKCQFKLFILLLVGRVKIITVGTAVFFFIENLYSPGNNHFIVKKIA